MFCVGKMPAVLGFSGRLLQFHFLSHPEGYQKYHPQAKLLTLRRKDELSHTWKAAVGVLWITSCAPGEEGGGEAEPNRHTQEHGLIFRYAVCHTENWGQRCASQHPRTQPQKVCEADLINNFVSVVLYDTWVSLGQKPWL